MLDFLNDLDPAVVGAIASGAFTPTVHDLLVKWNATPRFKAGASTVIAVIISLAAALAAPGDLTIEQGVVAVLAGLGLAETSYRKQKGLAKHTDRPTPLAVAPNFGIGDVYVYEGD